MIAFLSSYTLGNILNVACFRQSHHLVRTMARALAIYSTSNTNAYRIDNPTSGIRPHGDETIIRAAFKRNLDEGPNVVEAKRTLALLRYHILTIGHMTVDKQTNDALSYIFQRCESAFKFQENCGKLTSGV